MRMHAASLHMGPVVAGYSVHPSHPAASEPADSGSYYRGNGCWPARWLAVFDVVGWMMRAFTSAEGIQSRS